MSGGSLNYFYQELQEHIEDFRDVELNDLVSDLAELFHDREWFLSGDTGEGEWNEARDKFKEKWFTEVGRNVRLAKYLAEFTEEIRRSFGISEKYCVNCKNWTRCQEKRYGKCAVEKRCLFSEKEHCDKWERREESNGD